MRKPTALIVEDEAMIVIDLEFALTKAGFAVTAVPNCARTKQILALFEPDVAILDVLLQGCESTAVAEEFVARDIPFVVYSGTDVEGRGAAYQQGAYVSKPADVSTLVRLASSLVRP